MKSKMICLFLFLSSFYIHAEVDFTHCSNYIKTTNSNTAKTGFSLPFQIDSKTGKIETTNYNMTYDGEKKGIHEYKASGWAGSIKIVARENDNGRLSEISIETISKTPGVPPKVNTLVEFDVRNGKCFPKVARNDFKVSGTEVKTTIFDTFLCKDLKDYLDKNKDIKKCFDPESRENKKIESLFMNNGYKINEITRDVSKITPVLQRYSYSVEQKILTGTSKTFDTNSSNSDKENEKMLGLLGGSPMISAYMILNDCYEKGLETVLFDKEFWKNEAQANSHTRNSLESEQK